MRRFGEPALNTGKSVAPISHACAMVAEFGTVGALIETPASARIIMSRCRRRRASSWKQRAHDDDEGTT